MTHSPALAGHSPRGTSDDLEMCMKEIDSVLCSPSRGPRSLRGMLRRLAGLRGGERGKDRMPAIAGRSPRETGREDGERLGKGRETQGEGWGMPLERQGMGRIFEN